VCQNRFREEPYIYAEFLDILHDYQAKRTIDEVYQRVQKLFRGQPDLLDEFKYFLPESAVAPRPAGVPFSQAKSGAPALKPQAPVGAKVVSSAAKPGAGSGKPMAAQAKPGSAAGKPSYPPRPAVNAKPAGVPPRPANRDSRGNLIPSSGKDVGKKPGSGGPGAAGSSSHHSHRDKKHGDGHREHRHHGHHSSHPARVTFPVGCEKELGLLEKMRYASSKAQWIQFLKALNLFANDVISRGELLRMVEDVYGERVVASGLPAGSYPAVSLHMMGGPGELVERFKQSIGYDEAEEKTVASLNQTNYYAFVSSVDFTSCHQVTPSYRELPVQILVPHSTGRTQLGDEVLNDTCISIPTGSEDFSFKATRKNIYEENLFKSVHICSECLLALLTVHS
jgi:paired amphipathic helix protein Sin3a